MSGKAIISVGGMIALSACVVFGSIISLEKCECRIEEDFNSFEGTYQSLPTGFSVSKDGISQLTDTNDFKGLHAGGTREGACLGWIVGDGDIALGYQPTSDEFTPGWFSLTVTNSGNQIFRAMTISYDVLCLNNEDRSSSLCLEFSSDGNSFQRAGDLTFVSGAERDDSPEWTRSNLSATVDLPSTLEPGSCVHIRWFGEDAGGSGSRDEYGIDNVSVVFLEARGTLILVK